jgi:hypothetical protein
LADPQPFTAVKLICGIIASQDLAISRSEERLAEAYGPLDSRSPLFSFDFTDYYEKQMGKNLKRKFLSFQKLIEPESLSAIKLDTNRLEEEIREELNIPNRAVNLDPGYLTSASLIMATAKDFSHRIPLQNGIYAHLEFLFGKDEIRVLDWTYPDFRCRGYQDYFLGLRRLYLSQLKKSTRG